MTNVEDRLVPDVLSLAKPVRRWRCSLGGVIQLSRDYSFLDEYVQRQRSSII